MSIWQAVIPSAVPVTLKSMSPKCLRHPRCQTKPQIFLMQHQKSIPWRYPTQVFSFGYQRPSMPLFLHKRLPLMMNRWTPIRPTSIGWCMGNLQESCLLRLFVLSFRVQSHDEKRLLKVLLHRWRMVENYNADKSFLLLDRLVNQSHL